MKISIIGYSASGKSTLAQDISQTYDLPLLHLDQVNISENWQERDLDDAINIGENFMKQDDRVIDGNYDKLKKTERLALSDIIVFLNFNRFNCLARAIKRYIKYHGKTRESMAENCPEKLDFEFIKWILIDSRSKKKRENYANMKKHYSHKWIQINNQEELTKFKKYLQRSNASL